LGALVRTCIISRLRTVDGWLQVRVYPPWLLDRGHARGQPGLIARRGVLVQGALLDSLVEGGNGLAIRLFGSVLVAFCDGFTKFAQLGAQTGGIGAVARGSVFGLAGALQR
jgi:hypothetical protein